MNSSKVTVSNLANSLKLDTYSFDLNKDDVSLYSGAAEDDYVVIIDKAYAVKAAYDITKADIASGAVTSTKTNSENKVTDARVDGKWYTVADPTSTGNTIKLNDSYDFALINGFAFNADKTKGNISASNILYIDEVGALKSGLSAGVEAKVYFSDGTKKIVTITEVTKDDGKDYDVIANSKTPASDEITSSQAEAFLNGYSLYTFSEKNGEYSVEPVYNLSETNNNIGSYELLVNAAGKIKDGKVAGNRFNSDAVIFVKDNDGVKVVTGKTVTNWKEISAESVVGLADKSNGTPYIAIGAIDLGTGTAKTDARVYGFVTANNGVSKEGSTEYRNFTMWDGTQSIDVKVKSSVAVAKSDFVAFDWADQTAGEADKEDFYHVSANDLLKQTSDGKAWYGAGAITAFVDGDSITLNYNASTPKYFEFADTYFVIGVDTKSCEGSSGKLATAKEETKDTSLYRNAVVFTTKDGDQDVVEAVFVDVNGTLYTEKNGDECGYINVIK